MTKVSGRKMKATIAIASDRQRAPVDDLGAQIGELFVQQRRALAHRLELFGHAGEAVGGIAQMHPVLGADPVERQLRHRGQRVAIGRDEAAQSDRLRAQHRDPAAQGVDVAVLEGGLAIIELVAQLGDFGIERGADRLRQGRDEIAPVLEVPGPHRRLDVRQRSERAAAYGGDAPGFDPHPDRNQPVAVGGHRHARAA